jgi:hypothetical protein
MLSPLRGWLPVFKFQISLCLICSIFHIEVYNGNKPVYLPVPLCRIMALFRLRARAERHFCLLSIKLNHVVKNRSAFITANKNSAKQFRSQATTNRHQTINKGESSSVMACQVASVRLRGKLPMLKFLELTELLGYKLSLLRT